MRENHLAAPQLLRIRNFKATKSLDLELKPLTVILGSNSSGKSSIFQAVLLFLQNMEGEFGLRLDTVGNLVKLGNISEIHTRGQHEQSIVLEIVFESGSVAISFSEDLESTYHAPGDLAREPEAWLSKLQVEVSSSLGTERFVAVSDLESLREAFETSALESPTRGPAFQILADILDHSSDTCDPSEPHHVAFHKSVGDPLLSRIPRSQEPTLRGLLRGFLLQELTFEGRSSVGQNGELEVADPTHVELFGREEFVTALTSAIRVSSDGSKQNNDGEFIRKVFQITSSQVLLDAILDHNWRWVDEAALALGLDPDLPEEIGLALEGQVRGCWGSFISRVENAITESAEGFLYLGPLRHFGQELHPSQPASSPVTPLGLSGENALFQLWTSWRSGRKASYALPGFKVKSVTLIEAVNSWLDYFEIGKSLEVETRGNAGLIASVDGIPIYNLGTGFSQLLPVLVLCLIAKDNQVVLIEQPELHLHPSAQQKLADFFAGISLTGVRVAVETHSEYLVTRLRRLVVEQKIDSDAAQLLFAESGQGHSSYRISHLSDSGQFSYWPNGFFGSVEQDLLAILEADIRKSGSLD